MIIIKNIFPILIVLILSFFSIKPLLMSGFFPIHDDTQVARVYEMGKALSDGMFPVRWVQDLGYGYGSPTFNFYAPLAYYVGGFFNVLGFDALVSTKIMMIIGIILSGVFMYLLANELWGKIGGLVSSLFYMYAPYHAVDIYVRGDVAEFWAYAFIPLAFYGFLKAYKEKEWKYIVTGAFGFSAVILSHNLTAMMITPFLFFLLFFLLLFDTKEKISSTFYFLITLFFGLSISAFYWLPALFELKFTNVLSQIEGGANFRDHFVCIQQLWQSPWGFGGSAAGCVDGISFKIGKLHILLSLLAVAFLVISLRRKKFKNLLFKSNYQITFVIFSVFAFVISVFLTLEISKPIWEFIPAMAFFQFPWRFLLLMSFFSSILCGFSFWFVNKMLDKKFNKIEYLMLLGIIFILMIYSTKLFVPQTFILKEGSDYTNLKTLRWKTSKISDEYMPKNFKIPKSENEVVKNKIQIDEDQAGILYLTFDTKSLHASIKALDKTSININTAYFPSWNIFVDNKRSDFNVTNKGISLFVPKGDHSLDMLFIQTPVEKLGDSISLASVFLLIAGIILSRKRLSHE